MEELVKQVAQRTGITEDQARTAVNTVIGFLKERLPAPIAGQLDNLTAGGAGGTESGGAANMAGGLIGDLGSMLGGKKD